MEQIQLEVLVLSMAVPVVDHQVPVVTIPQIHKEDPLVVGVHHSQEVAAEAVTVAVLVVPLLGEQVEMVLVLTPTTLAAVEAVEDIMVAAVAAAVMTMVQDLVLPLVEVVVQDMFILL